jgi:hypothetical protein
MGLTPSPLFREILDAVYEAQLDGRVASLEEARGLARELLRARGALPPGPENS